MDEQNQTIKDLKEYMLTLPEKLQNYIAVSEWSTEADNMGKKYRLSEEGVENLRLEILLVLIGLNRVTDFKQSVREEIPVEELSDERLDALEEEMYSSLFMPVHRDLDTLVDAIDRGLEAAEKGEQSNPQQTTTTIPIDAPIQSVQKNTQQQPVAQNSTPPEIKKSVEAFYEERKPTYGEIRYVPESKLKPQPTPQPIPQEKPEPIEMPIPKLEKKEASQASQEHHELMIKQGMTEPITEAPEQAPQKPLQPQNIPQPRTVYIQTEKPQQEQKPAPQVPQPLKNLPQEPQKEDDKDIPDYHASIVEPMLKQHTTNLPKEEIVMSDRKPQPPQPPQSSQPNQQKDPYREPLG